MLQYFWSLEKWVGSNKRENLEMKLKFWTVNSFSFDLKQKIWPFSTFREECIWLQWWSPTDGNIERKNLFVVSFVRQMKVLSCSLIPNTTLAYALKAESYLCTSGFFTFGLNTRFQTYSLYESTTTRKHDGHVEFHSYTQNISMLVFGIYWISGWTRAIYLEPVYCQMANW